MSRYLELRSAQRLHSVSLMGAGVSYNKEKLQKVVYFREISPPALGFYRRFPEPFFLFSAHRFFINSDSRFLPAGVRWSFFSARMARWGTALFRATGFDDWPSSAAMA
jgi:hypothetical protein